MFYFPMNKKEAIRYYKMPADKCNSSAMYALILYNTEGITFDEKKFCN